MPDGNGQEQETFSYHGHLNFNALGVIQFNDSTDGEDEIDIEETIESLPPFEEEEANDPDNPESGYLPLGLEDYAIEADLNSDFIAAANRISGFEYREEDWKFEEIVVDGESQFGQQRTIRDGYLYVDEEEFVYAQGNQPIAAKTLNRTKATLENGVNIWEIDFHPEFLLWLLWKDDKNQSIPGNLNVRTITDAEVEGDNPNIGSDIDIGGTTNATHSIAVIAGVLKNMNIQKIKGSFNVFGNFVNARVKSSGRLKIYTTSGDMEGASDLVQVIHGIELCRQFVDLRDRWRRLDDSDKYVHPRYFAELHERADSTYGAEYKPRGFDFGRLVEDYANKRNEDPDGYDFDFSL